MQSNESGTTSVWQAWVEPRAYTPLMDDTEADVCVVGGGLAGVATAYELAKNGKRVVLLEKEANLAAGETSKTTAHLANAMDDRFVHLEKHISLDASRQARESHGAAIDWIERTARDLGIDCDFRRLDGFLVAGEEEPSLDEEHAAAKRAGFADAELLASSPVEGLGGPVIRFPNQAEYHPLKFLNGVADAFVALGGRVYTSTQATSACGGDDGRVETATGQVVRARHVVLATNSPAARYVETMKMVPYRTYVVAFEIPAGSVAHALYWDTMDPYHYIRLVRDGGRELLVVGGGDHQTGTSDEGDAVFADLERWTRDHFEIPGTPLYRWSGQVLEPADHLAFIGRSHDDEDVFICTGDSGQGMTHSVIAAMRIGDLVLGRPERWPVYDPRRISLKPGALREYLRDLGMIGKKVLDHVKPGDAKSTDDIPPGTGAVVRRGLKEIAAYRDENGTLHERSAICTHAGCIVHWNSTEGSWDCPCHGSRFSPDGDVLNGPAVTPLRRVE